jgi:hypothetical protein
MVDCRGFPLTISTEVFQCNCLWANFSHKTGGECIRSKNLRIGYCRSATGGNDYTQDKKWNKELDTYAAVRKEGIQPDTTKMSDIRIAQEVSDKTGEPYGKWE